MKIWLGQNDVLDRVRDVADHGSIRLEGHVVAPWRVRVGNAVGKLLAAHVDECVLEHLAVAVCGRTSIMSTQHYELEAEKRNLHANGTRSPAFDSIVLDL